MSPRAVAKKEKSFRVIDRGDLPSGSEAGPDDGNVVGSGVGDELEGVVGNGVGSVVGRHTRNVTRKGGSSEAEALLADVASVPIAKRTLPAGWAIPAEVLPVTCDLCVAVPMAVGKAPAVDFSARLPAGLGK